MVPIQFEYVESGEFKVFVVVVGTFKHHYTEELMYRIRADYIDPETGCPYSDYLTVTEADIMKLLETQIKE